MSGNSVQQARLRQRFALYDTNGDGRIDRSDLEQEAQRIVEAFGETQNSPRAQALLNAYPQMFDFLNERSGAVAGGSMTEEQFLAAAEKEMLSDGIAGFGRVLQPSIRAMVELCDTDGDGQVSPTEFQKWLTAISAEIDAKEAFRAVDTDGNGRLSVDELVAAVGRYHAGELNAPLLGV